MKHCLTIIVISFLGVVFASAQNISVTDFHLDEMDQTANLQGTTVLDQNGEKCALIKVKTTQTDLNFDVGALGVTKTVQKTAQIWVYVPHGVRKFTISHQKYGTLDYQLPVTTQKAKTYIMDLKAETPLPVNSQRLTIKCQPKNAVVLIDGEMVNITNGMAEITLKLGTHKYQAMANDYFPQDGSVELKSDRPGKLTIELDSKIPENNVAVQNELIENTEDNGFECLGAKLRPVNNEEKSELNIKYGLKITKITDGAFQQSGIPVNFIILTINKIPMKSYSDMSNVVMGEYGNKKPILIIQGCYPSGEKEYFTIPLS